jgi:hypothetical protein
MANTAKVDSIDAVKEFRVYMAKFGESCALAMGDCDSDMHKTVRWVEGEQQAYWAGHIRKRQEILAKAEEALRYKRAFKDATGSTPSAVEEIKAVNAAKKNLAEAQQKLANCKMWARRLQKEITLYRGGIARFNTALSSSVPMAIAQLGTLITILEKYVGIGVGGEGDVAAVPDVFGDDSGSSAMSRGSSTAIQWVDPRSLRVVIPPMESLEAGEALPLGAVDFAFALFPAEQQDMLAKLTGSDNPIAEDAVIAIAQPAFLASRIFMVRLPDAAPTSPRWFIGAIEEREAKVFRLATAKNVLAGRVDLRDLLKLPAGFMVIIEASGVAAVYDEKDEDVFDKPVAAGAATDKGGPKPG